MNRYNKGQWKRPSPAKFFFFFMMALLFLSALGFVVMYLWNNILVDATGVNPLNYWEAVGLFVLSRILFGGFKFGGGHKRHSKRAHWHNKWKNMTEEERAAFKERWKRKREE